MMRALCRGEDSTTGILCRAKKLAVSSFSVVQFCELHYRRMPILLLGVLPAGAAAVESQ